jgi:hypothetical protein
MINNLIHATKVSFFIAILTTLSACVEEDYDLSKDIDLTMQAGGNLTIPTSSTDQILLSQILDLEESSSIKEVQQDGDYGLAAGDYVLLVQGDESSSNFVVNKVYISDLQGSTVSTEVADFGNAAGADQLTIPLSPTTINISLSDDHVDNSLVEIDQAYVSSDVNISLGYSSSNFTGSITLCKGYKLTFPKAWTIEVTDANSSELLSVGDDGHSATLLKDYTLARSNSLSLKIHIAEIDFTKLGNGSGYSNGKLNLNCDIVSTGDISVATSGITSNASPKITLNTTAKISRATINAVTGIVDPAIRITPNNFRISDTPDFLSDENNVLDIDNPRIEFTAVNESPVSVEINAILTGYIDGKSTADVAIGAANGTDAILLPGNQTTTVVISRRPIANSDKSNVVVPTLSNLIRKLPDKIEFHDVSCKAVHQPTTIQLSQYYGVTTSSNVIVPLAFGKDMTLVYSYEDFGWDADLKDYNFSQVEITADTENTLPLEMVPTVVGVDRNGNDITDITVKVEGDITPGTVENPSLSQLKITLTSTADNWGELDGIRFLFDAATTAESVGINMNSAQMLRFENIKIQLVGGAIINLN